MWQLWRFVAVVRVLFLLDQFSLPPARKPCSWDLGEIGFACFACPPVLFNLPSSLIFFALIGDRRCSSTSAAAATGIYTSPPSSWGFSMQREILIPFSVSVDRRACRASPVVPFQLRPFCFSRRGVGFLDSDPAVFISSSSFYLFV